MHPLLESFIKLDQENPGIISLGDGLNRIDILQPNVFDKIFQTYFTCSRFSLQTKMAMKDKENQLNYKWVSRGLEQPFFMKKPFDQHKIAGRGRKRKQISEVAEVEVIEVDGVRVVTSPPQAVKKHISEEEYERTREANRVLREAIEMEQRKHELMMKQVEELEATIKHLEEVNKVQEKELDEWRCFEGSLNLSSMLPPAIDTLPVQVTLTTNEVLDLDQLDSMVLDDVDLLLLKTKD